MEALEYLRKKAADLPLSPGVYLMKNSSGKIIYVGKSKALRNRVSSYFAKGEQKRHSPKTLKMVSNVADFDFMLTDTEIEALALENKLIKLHMPRYNIKLKDGKSYPYIKIWENNGYPSICVTRKRSSDNGKYFGPYSGMGYAYEILETVRRIFALPTCSHVFPRDVGKVRPCIYSQMNRCFAPCKNNTDIDEMRDIYDKVTKFLKGNIRDVKKELTEKMMAAAEDMKFELAALWRDRIAALDKLLEKQKAVTSPDSEYDAICLYRGDVTSCLTFGIIREGVLTDATHVMLGGDAILEGDSLTSAIIENYNGREYVPSEIVLDFDPGEDELQLLSSYMTGFKKIKCEVRVAQRGDKRQICNMLAETAAAKVMKYDKEMASDNSALVSLAMCAGLEVVPSRIEAVDISNYGSEIMTGGLISFVDGKPNKAGYRIYNIKNVKIQNDYGSMREVISRRLEHANEDPLPDLLLLDGGVGHVNTIKELLNEKGVYLPVLGMVKDQFHKTRTLTDGENEISISGEGAVYSLIYRIQEEVHRFSISKMRARKTKTLLTSRLTDVEGIGDKKAAILMKAFKSVQNVKRATADEISAVKGISRRDAENITEYFNKDKGNDK